MAEPRFGRVIPAMITPFDENLKVDLNRMQELAVRLVDGGVSSVLVCGTTGESPTICLEDKLRLYRATFEAVGNRVPVIANVGSNCTSDSIELAKRALVCGASGIMAVVPFYNKPPQEGLYQHFSAIANAVDLPIILYNIPGRCGINMTAETTLRLAHDHENIVAVKEASGKLDQIAAIAAGAPEGFSVYSGDDDMTLDIMEVGGVGVISTIGNLCPQRMVEIVDAFVAGDHRRAHELSGGLHPLMKGLFKTANPILLKESLKLIGFDCGGVRLPLIDATDAQREELEATMREVGVL